MKQKILLLVLLLLGTAVYAYTLKNDIAPNQKLGRNAPAFELISEKGVKVTSEQLKGKTILLHFWATWCPPCGQEFPALQNLSLKLPKNMVLLAVSVDEDPKVEIPKFRKHVPFNFPVYTDPSGELADKMGTYGLPETYVISPDGKVIKKFTGPEDWNDPEVLKQIGL